MNKKDKMNEMKREGCISVSDKVRHKIGTLFHKVNSAQFLTPFDPIAFLSPTYKVDHHPYSFPEERNVILSKRRQASSDSA